MKEEYRELVKKLFIGENKSCSETVFEAALKIRGIEPEEKCFFMMCGFSGGLSCGHDCGAVTGGVAAISYLYCDGTKESKDKVKELSKAFVERAEAEFGTITCKTLKVYWRKNEETRCIALVEKTLEILLETIG